MYSWLMSGVEKPKKVISFSSGTLYMDGVFLTRVKVYVMEPCSWAHPSCRQPPVANIAIVGVGVVVKELARNIARKCYDATVQRTVVQRSSIFGIEVDIPLPQ